MLVVSVVNKEEAEVIHYNGSEETDSGSVMSTVLNAIALAGGKAEIVKHRKYLNPKKDHIDLLEYEDGVALYTGEKAVKRAREKIGEDKYHLFSNNCECFVNWVITGEEVSEQVKTGVKIAVGGAIALGASAAIVGAALYGRSSGTRDEEEEEEEDTEEEY